MKNRKLRFSLVFLAFSVVVALAVTKVSGIRFLHWTLAVVVGAALFTLQAWHGDQKEPR